MGNASQLLPTPAASVTPKPYELIISLNFQLGFMGPVALDTEANQDKPRQSANENTAQVVALLDGQLDPWG